MSASTSHAAFNSSAVLPLRAGWRRGIWIAAALVAAAFFAHAAARFLNFSEASYQKLWVNRYWLLPHFLFGSVALICGVLQFSARLRSAYAHVHRWVGRTYLAGVGGSAACAYALSFRAVLGWPFGVAAFVMASAWIGATVFAYVAIRRGKVDLHREWMLRSYVITFGFVVFRIMVVSPLFAGLGSLAERLTVLLWLSWTVPLLVAEFVLQSRALRVAGPVRA